MFLVIIYFSAYYNFAEDGSCFMKVKLLIPKSVKNMLIAYGKIILHINDV